MFRGDVSWVAIDRTEKTAGVRFLCKEDFICIPSVMSHCLSGGFLSCLVGCKDWVVRVAGSSCIDPKMKKSL